MLRLRRLLAMARYEVRTHNAGSQGRRLALLALGLLLPASLVPNPVGRGSVEIATVPGEAAAPQVRVAVRGTVPPLLRDHMVLSPTAEPEILDTSPLRVRTVDVPGDLRAALETLPGESRVEIRHFHPPLRLPRRSLLIAILAISLLTGPLAEALPGERARRTLEVLLSAGISRGELVGGKWLAWTAMSTLAAAVGAAIIIGNGVQEAGLWLLGLPMFVGTAVALGLWLVRLADDVVGGAAAPMRVLPVAATAMAVVAWLLRQVSPELAAAVPLGGPLLVSGALLDGAGEVVAAGIGTAAACTLLLARTGADLDRFEATHAMRRHGAIGLAVVAIVLWWLAVAAPAVWILAGNETAATALPRSWFAGGTALLCCAVLACVREGRAPWPTIPPRALPWALLAGALLGIAGPLTSYVASPPQWAQPLSARLLSAAVPDPSLALVPALVSVVGQIWLFHVALAPRVGWLLASVLWVVAVAPFDPFSAIPAALALGLLTRAHGAGAAAVAHLTWMAVATWMAPGAVSPPAAVALQLAAAALSVRPR